MILLTLLLQGLTLPYLIKRSGLFENLDEQSEEETKQKIKKDLTAFTLDLLKKKQQEGLFEDNSLLQMIDLWQKKMNQPENFKMTPESKQYYLDLLEKQRQYLAALNKDPQLDESLIPVSDLSDRSGRK